MPGFVGMLYVCTEVREITGEASVSLRGVGGGGLVGEGGND